MALFALGGIILRGQRHAFEVEPLARWFTANAALSGVLLTGLVAAAWGLSYLVSVRLFEAKDF